MCLIVAVTLLVLSIQSLILGNWYAGIFQLLVALGFFALLLRNFRLARCERNGNCQSCTPQWFTSLLSRKEE